MQYIGQSVAIVAPDSVLLTPQHSSTPQSLVPAAMGLCPSRSTSAPVVGGQSPATQGQGQPAPQPPIIVVVPQPMVQPMGQPMAQPMAQLPAIPQPYMGHTYQPPPPGFGFQPLMGQPAQSSPQAGGPVGGSAQAGQGMPQGGIKGLKEILGKVSEIETRTSINMGGGPDCLRHGHFVSTGELWTMTPGLCQGLGCLASQGITSYGQAKAAADEARGQHQQLQIEAARQGLRAGLDPDHQD